MHKKYTLIAKIIRSLAESDLYLTLVFITFTFVDFLGKIDFRIVEKS